MDKILRCTCSLLGSSRSPWQLHQDLGHRSASTQTLRAHAACNRSSTLRSKVVHATRELDGGLKSIRFSRTIAMPSMQLVGHRLHATGGCTPAALGPLGGDGPREVVVLQRHLLQVGHGAIGAPVHWQVACTVSQSHFSLCILGQVFHHLRVATCRSDW